MLLPGHLFSITRTYSSLLLFNSSTVAQKLKPTPRKPFLQLLKHGFFLLETTCRPMTVDTKCMVPYERPWELYRGLITAADLIWPVCPRYSIIFFTSPLLLVRYILYLIPTQGEGMQWHTTVRANVQKNNSVLRSGFNGMSWQWQCMVLRNVTYVSVPKIKRKSVDNKKDTWIP